MPLTVDAIIDLYRTRGAVRYGKEAIDQQQHALQCGLLVQQAGASDELVAAALLHDLGHLLAVDLPDCQDDLHEYRVIPFLRGAFPEAVIEPIRMHVDAKRYLCFAQPGYFDGLSTASKASLAFQGGAFGEREAEDFIQQPHARDAVLLRRWDDHAKSPTRTTPGWSHFRAVLEGASLYLEAAVAG